MEWILIDENRLKITLSEPDMRRYALSAEDMEVGLGETRAAFRHLLADTRVAIGFETEGARLLLQFYTSREGGGELFVTRLPGEESPPSSPEERVMRGEEALLRSVYGREERLPPEERMTRGEAAYGFSSPEELLRVCRRLDGMGYDGKSRVYIVEDEEGETWYLFLTHPCQGLRESLMTGSIPGEYGKAVCGSRLLSVRERGRLICAEAGVSVLGKL